MRAHLSINVKDVSRSVDFYMQVFEQNPQKTTETYAKFDLKNPALNFSMLAAKDGRNPSQVNHLGIEVESSKEVIRWKDHLKSIGVDTISEEGTNCCYALQDKIWFKDPDGNAWEVFFVHEQLPTQGAEPPQTKSSCSASGCC